MVKQLAIKLEHWLNLLKRMLRIIVGSKSELPEFYSVLCSILEEKTNNRAPAKWPLPMPYYGKQIKAIKK